MQEVQEGGRELGVAGRGEAGPEPRPPGPAACAIGLAALAAVLGVAGRFLNPEAWAQGGWPVKAAAVVAAALLSTVVWAARRSIFRTLTSLPFAVALLAWVLLATALGTFVIQGAAPEEYSKKYGSALA